MRKCLTNIDFTRYRGSLFPLEPLYYQENKSIIYRQRGMHPADDQRGRASLLPFGNPNGSEPAASGRGI